MLTLIAARHAHAASNDAESVNGVPPGEPLTELGLEQALALGSRLDGEPVDLAVVTAFRRTAETADVALEGRDVPRLVLPELNEIAFGRYEGGTLAEYREWAWTAPADEPCPGGGDSRGAAAARYAAALETLLGRPEETVLAVAHALPLRYLLDAAEGRIPVRRIEPVPHAEPFRLGRAAVERAAEVLGTWGTAPAFM